MLFGKAMRVCGIAGILALLAVPSYADSPASSINGADTVWVLISTALVMLMTPGLGLFYGGMVRRKNVLATILQSFSMVGLIGMIWVLFGYSLAFGRDHWGLIGSLDWVGLKNVGLLPNPEYSATIPHQAFMIYQAMFAIITPALITGAFAERMNFKAYMIFAGLWSVIVYCPVAHWVWAPGGWLKQMGALDFAGGLVVHVSSGIAALCCAIVLGRRKGFGKEEFTPHNLTMTLVGTALLWFGWFGFNAGSSLAANGIAVSAFVATNTAGCAAAFVWIIMEWMHLGRPTALGAATGAVAGLAAVTPASGFIGPLGAMCIGIVVSVICYFAITWKNKLHYDDSLDVFGVHGVGGMWGVLAVGIFASQAVNPSGANGLLAGNASLIVKQLVGILAIGGYSFVVTFILLKLTSLFGPLRISAEDEETGLDLSQHGEIGYHF